MNFSLMVNVAGGILLAGAVVFILWVAAVLVEEISTQSEED